MRLGFIILCILSALAGVFFLSDPDFSLSNLGSKEYMTDKMVSFAVNSSDRREMSRKLLLEIRKMEGYEELDRNDIVVYLGSDTYIVPVKYTTGTLIVKGNAARMYWIAVRRDFEMEIAYLGSGFPNCEDIEDFAIPNYISRCVGSVSE